MAKREPFEFGDLPEEVQRALEADIEAMGGLNGHGAIGQFVSVACEQMEEVGMTHSDALYTTLALMTGNPGPAPRI